MPQKGQWRSSWAGFTLFLFTAFTTTLIVFQHHKSQTKIVIKRNPEPLQEFADTVTKAFKLFVDNVVAIDANRTKITGRSLLTDLGDLLGGGDDSSSSSSSGSSSITSGITSVLGDAASGLLDDVAGDLGGPAFYLGIGLGSGAAQGLNLSTAAKTTEVATTIAEANSVSNSSINTLVQNLGTGLTASLVSSVNVSSLTGSATSNIGPAVLALAQGLGNGTSSGLNLGSASTQTQALAVANGTNLSIADITGLFGYGLSRSIAQNVQLPSLSAANLSLSSLSSSGVFQILVPAASGFGQGLGQGIPIGLGLAEDTASPIISTTGNTTVDISNTAQLFAKGFTSQFLANGTLTRLQSSIGSSSLLSGTSSISVAKGAEGFARGFVQGVGNGVQSATSSGDGNVAEENVSSAPPASLLAFNDTLGGAAVGFGYGLGDQGASVVSQFFQSSVASTTTTSNSDNSTAAVKRALSNSPARKRFLGTSGENKISVISSRGIDLSLGSFNLSSFNLSALITANGISKVAQTGADDLTCEGVGGLATVFLGLISSGTIPSSLLHSANNFTDLLPNGTITLQSGGNQYDIALKPTVNIQVNGLSLVKLIVLIVLHALLLIVVFLLALPLAVTLLSLRSISLLAGNKDTLPKAQKWADIVMFYIVPPVTILGFVLGIAVMGNAKQFRTGHEILGLLTFLLTIPTVGLYYLATRKPQFALPVNLSPALLSNLSLNGLLNLSLLTILLAFRDISTLSFCVTQAIPFSSALGLGIFISSAVNAAMMLQTLEWWLQRKSNKARKEEMDEEALERKRKPPLKISAPVVVDYIN